MKSISAELVRFTRRFNYKESEGFNESTIIQLEPEQLEHVDAVARDLAIAAGVSREVAGQAYVCWLVTGDAARLP
jgi:hypothetical protein